MSSLNLFSPLFFFHKRIPSYSLFPSRPSFHSSFSSRSHLGCFTLNVPNIDRWGFPAPPLEQKNLKKKYGCMCASALIRICMTVCLFTGLYVALCTLTALLCHWGNLDTCTLPGGALCFLQGEVTWHKSSWDSTATISATMKVTCDCYASIYSMMRPLRYT